MKYNTIVLYLLCSNALLVIFFIFIEITRSLPPVLNCICMYFISTSLFRRDHYAWVFNFAIQTNINPLLQCLDFSQIVFKLFRWANTLFARKLIGLILVGKKYKNFVFLCETWALLRKTITLLHETFALLRATLHTCISQPQTHKTNGFSFFL